MVAADDGLNQLHEDVVRSFERIETVVLRSRELKVIQDGPEADRQLELLRENFEAVRHLELMMPVVAPMKAGKSTLINTIVGYRLLPARANPMTTLPTKIMLVDDLDLASPELHLPHQLRRLYRDVESAIRKSLRAGRRVPGAHAYLKPLATGIADSAVDELRETYVGTTEVHKVLVRLNDELRLAALTTDEDFLAALTHLPVLRTGYLHEYEAGRDRGGQLVIIDTPGANESAMVLGPALEAQLERSHVVLVVMDYTQMGSEAATDVRNRLQRPLEIIGTDRLYAVVNKVDNRKEAWDQSKEDTRSAVQDVLGLSDEQAAKQIFEVVANWGLTGSRVLADLERFGENFDASRSDSGRSLMRERYPIDPEEDRQERLAEASLREIRRDAEYMLRRSGVTDMVRDAISQLRRSAAPTVIGSGLSRVQASLRSIDENIALEVKATAANRTKVNVELARLEKQIEAFKRHQAKLPGVAALEAQFEAQLNSFVRDLREDGLEIIEGLGNTAAQKQSRPRPDSLRTLLSGAGRRLRGIWPGGADDDTYSASSQAVAQEVIDKIVSGAVEELKVLLQWGRVEVETRVRKYAAIVVDEQQKKVQGLLLQTTNALADAFDVKLTPPPPAVENGELKIELAPDVSSYTYKQEYQDTEMRRNPWTLWITKKEYTVTRSRNVTSHTYSVSRSALVKQLTNSLDTEIARIRGGLNSYVATRLRTQLTTYYNDLSAYLDRYEGALRRSVNTSEASAEVQKQRRADLEDLRLTLHSEQERLKEYQSRLAHSSG